MSDHQARAVFADSQQPVTAATAPAELRRGPPAPRIAWVKLSELTPPRCSDILIGNPLAEYDDDNGPVFIVRVYADGFMRTADGYMFAPHDGLLWSPLPALPSAADPLDFELIADQIADACAPVPLVAPDLFAALRRLVEADAADAADALAEVREKFAAATGRKS